MMMSAYNRKIRQGVFSIFEKRNDVMNLNIWRTVIT